MYKHIHAIHISLAKEIGDFLSLGRFSTKRFVLQNESSYCVHVWPMLLVVQRTITRHHVAHFAQHKFYEKIQFQQKHKNKEFI